MFLNIIYNIPNWLLAICIVGFIVIVSLLGQLAVRTALKRQSIQMENEIVSGLGHLAGIIFAIVAGFVAVAVLGAFDKAGNIVEDEANQAFTIWVDARAYPANFESKVRDAIENYLNVVIHDEWPKQSQGEISLDASRSFENLYRLIIDYSPTSQAGQAVHNQILSKVNKIFEDRSSRKYINDHGLPSAVYYEIIFSIIVVLGFAWCFTAKNPKGHIILTGLLSIGIGLIFFLIIAFDYPFRGTVSIQPDSYQNAIEHIQRLKIEQPISAGI